MLTPISIARSGFIASGQVGWPHHASGAVRSGHVGNDSVLSGSTASGQAFTYDFASGATVTRSQFVAPFVSGTPWNAITEEPISGVRAVYLSLSGRLGIAMASVSGRLPAVGIVPTNVASGIQANVYTVGAFQFPSGMANYSGYLGQPVFVGRSGQIVTRSGSWNSGGFIPNDIEQRLGLVTNSGGIVAGVAIPTYPPPLREECLLFRTSNQLIESGVRTPIIFDGETRDPYGMHSSSSGSIIQVPRGGLYQTWFSFSWQLLPPVTRHFGYFMTNNVTFNAGVDDTTTIEDTAPDLTASDLIPLNSGDRLDVQVFHTGLSGNVFIFSDGVTFFPRFKLLRVGD